MSEDQHTASRQIALFNEERKFKPNNSLSALGNIWLEKYCCAGRWFDSF
jgi:hypothetical protein